MTFIWWKLQDLIQFCSDWDRCYINHNQRKTPERIILSCFSSSLLTRRQLGQTWRLWWWRLRGSWLCLWRKVRWSGVLVDDEVTMLPHCRLLYCHAGGGRPCWAPPSPCLLGEAGAGRLLLPLLLPRHRPGDQGGLDQLLREVTRGGDPGEEPLQHREGPGGDPGGWEGWPGRTDRFLVSRVAAEKCDCAERPGERFLHDGHDFTPLKLQVRWVETLSGLTVTFSSFSDPSVVTSIVTSMCHPGMEIFHQNLPLLMSPI